MATPDPALNPIGRPSDVALSVHLGASSAGTACMRVAVCALSPPRQSHGVAPTAGTAEIEPETNAKPTTASCPPLNESLVRMTHSLPATTAGPHADRAAWLPVHRTGRSRMHWSKDAGGRPPRGVRGGTCRRSMLFQPRNSPRERPCAGESRAKGTGPASLAGLPARSISRPCLPVPLGTVALSGLRRVLLTAARPRRLFTALPFSPRRFKASDGDQ